MELKRISFTPSCDLEISKCEVDLLMRLSASHYDSYCREVGKVGGFLYGLRNRFEAPSHETDARLDFRQIDTLCKILEPARHLSLQAGLATNLYVELSKCLMQLKNVCSLQMEIR